MGQLSRINLSVVLLLAAWSLAACAPAVAPSATTLPAPAASPAAVSKPAASPAPGGSQAASPAAAASPQASPAAQAQPAATADRALASVWEGKTVTVIIGENTGGGYDSWGRLIARYIGRHLPGKPNVIAENMPGAGHRIAMNALFTARPDGLTMGLVSNGIPGFQLAGEGPEQGVRYDVTKMTWLGSPTVGTRALAIHQRAGITSAQQLQSRPVKVSHTQQAGIVHMMQVVLNDALGWKLQPIFGYTGSAEQLLSIERGELDAIITEWDSLARTKGDDIRSGTLKPYVQIGQPWPDPLLSGVPTADELFASKGDIERQLLALVQRPSEFSRPFVAPPGLTAAVASAMRAAFAATLADPDFLADARQLRFEVIPVHGDRVQSLVTDYMQTPKPIVDRLNALVEADSQ